MQERKVQDEDPRAGCTHLVGAFVYLKDQPREKETGWAAEKLLHDLEEDLCGGRNILNSMNA